MKRLFAKHLLTKLTVLIPGVFFCLPAFAQTTTVGAIFTNLSDQFYTVPGVVAFFSYVSATILAVMGLLNLKTYGDDPSSMPLRSIIIKFVLAACLVSLPFAIRMAGGTVTGQGDMSALQGEVIEKRSVVRPGLPRLKQ